MTRPLAGLAAVTLAVAAAMVVPAGALFGPAHWACGAVAFGLSLPPALGTLALTLWLARASAFGGLYGMAIGPIVRIGVVLVGAGGIFLIAQANAVPELSHPLTFWLWVAFAAVVTLTAETVLLVRVLGVKVSEGAGVPE